MESYEIMPPRRGTLFARAAQCLMQSGGRRFEAERLASALPNALAVKSAIAAATTIDSDWASPLSSPAVTEFSAILRNGSIMGRLQGARRPPLNTSYTNQTAAAAFAWVGQGQPAPVSELALARNTLGFAKTSGIIVVTQELAISSAPSAVGIIQDDLERGAIEFLDQAFINPYAAAVADVSPASITHGLTPLISTGSAVAQIVADLTAMVEQLADDNEVGALFWVMSRADVVRLALLRGSDGAVVFPNLNVNGGEIAGIPVIASNSTMRSVSGGSTVALINAEGIDVADDDRIGLDVSNEAALQMDSAPSSGAQQLVSLYQANLVGVRLTKYANWRRTRDTAVAIMTNVHW